MPSADAGQDSGTRPAFENAAAWPGITYFLLLAVLLPAVAACGILYRQALPVPYQDDYAQILAFSTDYAQSHDLKSKLLEIATTQVNEYKLGFLHAIVAFELELTHHLSFAFLTGLGNLSLLPIGYLLWLTYQEQDSSLDQRLLAFLPISLLFFSLTYWENLNWATTDLQNIPVILFSLLAIYLLFPGKMVEAGPVRLILACLAAALAAFTSANGFLLGPVGLLIFLPRRAYATAVVWCASFLAPLAAYLYHYTPVVHTVLGAARYITRPLFFLAFLGCGAVPFRWPAAVLGVAILAVFWIAVRTRFDRTNPVSFYFTLWVLATAALVAWVRGASLFHIGSRYSIYSILMLIFCYSFLAQYLPGRVQKFDRRLFYVTSTILAFCICVLADVHAYNKLEARRGMVLAGIELYRTNPVANSPMIDQNLLQGVPGEREREQRALTNAIQEHVYTLPPQQEIR
jgi:hypothetical protein